MKNKHPETYSRMQNEPNQNGGDNSQNTLQVMLSKGVREQKSSPLSQEDFEEKLLAHVLCSGQPFTLVEEVEFRELIRSCLGDRKDDISIASSRTIRRMIDQMFHREKAYIKSEFHRSSGKVSFVIDCWTSSNQYAFQGVIACWVDDEWNLKSSVIDLTLLNGAHTGANIAKAFGDVLQEYNLWQKLLAVTTDNASNMNTMFEELQNLAYENNSTFNSTDYRVRCLAHIINLACQDMISAAESYEYEKDDADSEDGEADEIDDPEERRSTSNFIKKVREAVSGIRSSPQRREIFRTQCTTFGIKHKNLILDVPTRWNSTLDMLERALELKMALSSTLTCIKPLTKYKLKCYEWKRVQELTRLLTPFRSATRMISNSHSPTLSRSSAVYQALLSHLTTNTEERACVPSGSRTITATGKPKAWVGHCCTAAEEKLRKYYPTSDGLVYLTSTGYYTNRESVANYPIRTHD
jgi:hypothetical protein